MEERRAWSAERRAYRRLALEHEAVLTLKGSQGRPVRLRDVCPGGLYVELPPPAAGRRAAIAPLRALRGDAALVRFTADTASGVQHFEIRLKVARVFAGGMGVEFVDPNPAAVRALHVLAARQQRQGVARSPATLEAVRLAFRAAVAEHVKPRLGTLMSRIGAPLVAAASAARSNNEQQRFFDAIPVLDGSREAIAREVLSTVGERIAEFGDPHAPQRPDAVEAMSDGEISMELSLVNVDEFEDFLAVAELVSNAERRFEDAVRELEERLGYADSASVARHENPLGAACLCHAFRDALRGLPLHRDARMVLYRQLDAQVVSSFGAMYAALNVELERLGVHRPPRQRRKRPGRVEPPERTVTEVDFEMVSQLDPEPAPAPRSPLRTASSGERGAAATAGTARPPLELERPEPPALDLTRRAAPRPVGVPAAAGVATPTGEPPAWEMTGSDAPRESGCEMGVGPSPNAPPRPSALATARTLLGLQRQAAAPGAGAAAPPAAAAGTTRPLSVHEVVDALDCLQRDGFEAAPGTGARGLPAVLDGVLATQAEGDHRALPAEYADPLELLDRLFRAMLVDPLVGGAAAQRIGRLQPALHKANLLRAGLFDDEAHPARRVLDALGRLDTALHEDGASDGDNNLRVTVDAILDDMLVRFDRDVGTVAAAADRLDELCARVQAVYDRNVAATVAARETQQAFVRARGGAGGEDARTDLGCDTLSREWNVWLNRARRLQIGDSLLANEAGSPARRLQVAWIDADRETLLLVDSQGRGIDSTILQELAMRLRRGTATIVPGSRHALVARALRAVMVDMRARIEHVATHDRVTGLVNARQFHGEVRRALTDAVHNHVEHALLRVVLDRHDALLEQCGSAAAQRLLRVAAESLLAAHGDGGHVASLEPGVFAVLARDCTTGEARDAARRVCERLAALVVETGGRKASAAASIGLVVINKYSAGVEDLLEDARRAADAALAAGGDRVETTRPERGARPAVGPMMAWVPLLNRTLREDRPSFRWQLIAPAQDHAGEPPRYEFLLGVRDESGAPVPPEALLQTAVYYQHMAELDRWVVRNALAWMAANPRRLAEVGSCAINLADETLADERLVELLVEELLASGVPPAKVCFEVSESAVLANLAPVEELMFTLREYGCGFTLVDVGAGASACEHLERLPVDFVKIGGRIVRGVTTSAEDRALVQSIVEIARFTGRRTIAGSVEDEATLGVLREIGVDFVQGFAVSRPRHLDDDSPCPAPAEPVSDTAYADTLRIVS